MKKFLSKAAVFALGAMLIAGVAASCDDNKPSGGNIIPEGYYGTGLEYKDTYKSLVAQQPATLNYLGAPDGSDLSHVANFVDGLLTNDAYGRLVNNLATSVETNDIYTQYTIKIKKNVPWVDHNGKIAKGNLAGRYQELYVTIQDFITSAKYALDYTNNSQYAFMYAMFIEGAAEYSALTTIDFQQAGAPKPWSDAQRAAAIPGMARDLFNVEITSTPTADDLVAIRNFERVRYTAVDAHTLFIELNQSVPFFPTMLTFGSFLPISKSFLDFVGTSSSGFGAGREKILYNGPFYWHTQEPSKLVYKRNPLYHGARQFDRVDGTGKRVLITDDFNAAEAYAVNPVHITDIEYMIPTTEALKDNDYVRKLFEAGHIDGFSLSSKDPEGWTKYVKGADGTGTLEYDPDDPDRYPGPANPNTNSRFYDTIDYTWHMTININRPRSTTEIGSSGKFHTAATQKSSLTDSEMDNGSNALAIKEVRELYIKAFDYENYHERMGEEKIEQTQHAVNTYVPRGFAVDENNVDYIEHYYEQYAQNKGITVAEAKTRLEPGQYAFQLATGSAELALYRQRAQTAVDLYNLSADGIAKPITYPIKMEQIARLSGASWEELEREDSFVRTMNNRMNGTTVASNQKFILVDNDKQDSSESFSQNVHAGYGHFVTWGWAPDYGDPLTYLQSYVTNGDFSFALGTASAVTGYSLNGAGNAIVKNTDVLKVYSDLVAEASRETGDYSARYMKFAKAEYELLENVACILPLYNSGQGWNASVSKAFGYGNPTSPYGLAGNKLINMWVLTEPPTRTKRYEVYAWYTADKLAALQRGQIAIYPDYVWETSGRK